MVRTSSALSKSAGPGPRGGAAFPFVCLLGLALLAFAGCATAPNEYREPPPLAATARAKLNRQTFDRTWELVRAKYFDPRLHGVDWAAMRAEYRPQAEHAADDAQLYRVLNRLCAELKESHLVALAPRRAHELATDHRVAIGITWELIDGRRVVTDIVPGSPAALAGVQRGWVVVARDGSPWRDGETFVARIGQPVTFEFLDETGQARTLTMPPQLLSLERTEVRELDGGLVYLRFDAFNYDALAWLSAQLKAHARAPGVALDLRRNPGGNTLALRMAVAEFFPRRVETGRLVKRDGSAKEARSFSWRSARYAGRVVLLTSPATGSAAEIFAHVLQFHTRATVIGQPTAGAVIYSRLFDLPGDGCLQIPVIDYIGLDGRRLEGRGVTPDLVLPRSSLADLRAGHDGELAAALELLQRPAITHRATAKR